MSHHIVEAAALHYTYPDGTVQDFPMQKSWVLDYTRESVPPAEL